MSLLPDPDALLAVAGRIAAHAAALRRHAHALGWSVAHTTWHGTAAHAFARDAVEVCAALRHSAGRLDAAAAALRGHAARVRTVLDDLRRLGVDLGAVGNDTGHVLATCCTTPAVSATTAAAW
ncbi:hypothetical protein [uncultured Jatrophihabitans sp.]|uniref:hypothetical protein n=1 Tax=uncultured Jatrophihabitans sp. TaxID=1610747 RepID=UPI0035C9A856